MSSQSAFDLIVVGGGILGTCAAWHALEAGYKVALFERNKQPRQATVRNFGQIVPSGLSQSWLPHGRKSLEFYQALHEKGNFPLRQEGTYYFASDEDEQILAEELFHINQELGYSCKLLSKQEVLTRQPSVKSDYIKSAIYFPKEFSVDPRLMVGKLLDFLSTEKQLEYLPYQLVIGVDRKGSNELEVCTSSGKKLRGKKVLICSGAEVQTLFPDAFPSEELKTVLLHMLISKQQPRTKIRGNILSGWSIRRYESFRACPSYQVIKEREQMPKDLKDHGIHILFKQTDNGEVIIGDSHHYADGHGQDDLGFDFNKCTEELMLTEAQKIVNLDTWDLSKVWTGIYAQCNNGDVFTKTIDKDIHILTAIGGKGMTASPGYTHHFTHKNLLT